MPSHICSILISLGCIEEAPHDFTLDVYNITTCQQAQTSKLKTWSCGLQCTCKVDAIILCIQYMYRLSLIICKSHIILRLTSYDRDYTYAGKIKYLLYLWEVFISFCFVLISTYNTTYTSVQYFLCM